MTFSRADHPQTGLSDPTTSAAPKPTTAAAPGPTTAALALGSGGARGYAHIGVIAEVQARGLEIVTVAGSSMGALVGGVFAVGRLDDYAEWASGLSQFDVLRLLDPSMTAPGAIRAEKVLIRVRELLGGALIEDLPVDYTAVATDVLARKEVWFQEGPLDTAIRASIAIPGVITPVMLNGRLLADGGLMDPVPIAPTTSSGADVVIAVSLAGDHREPTARDLVMATAEDRPLEEWVDRFRRSASKMLDRDLVRSMFNRFGGGGAERGSARSGGSEGPESDPFDPLPDGLGTFDMMNLSLDAMQSVLTRYRLAGHPPDVLIEIPKDACRSLDFHRATDMIALGRQLAAEALDRAGVPPAAAQPTPC